MRKQQIIKKQVGVSTDIIMFSPLFRWYYDYVINLIKHSVRKWEALIYTKITCENTILLKTNWAESGEMEKIWYKIISF